MIMKEYLLLLATIISSTFGSLVSYRQTVPTAFNYAFFNQWHCIGLSQNVDFKKPYKFNIGELPLVLWKDNNDNLLSTVNICRHLGSMLDSGPIVNGSLLCPYHGLKHDKKQAYGKIIDYQGKLWWSYKPVKKTPHSIPLFNKKGYTTQHVQIDMNAGLKDCAYNSMDLHHPEFVHKGLLGFGSSVPPSQVRTIPFIDRVGLEFDYHIKSNIRYISSDMNITKRDKYTKNFNMFIEPSTGWSKVSIGNSDKNLIISVNMLPIREDVTRWFVSLHHNFNNDNAFHKYIMKTATRLILSQDFMQFRRMYPDNPLKEASTFQFMLKHDAPIEYIKEMLKNYTYPDIKVCTNFVKMTRKS
jgi:phenylpropionate dioxygenase-like ring-hydroxylating dioxygenase large terminal subunit